MQTEAAIKNQLMLAVVRSRFGNKKPTSKELYDFVSVVMAKQGGGAVFQDLVAAAVNCHIGTTAPLTDDQVLDFTRSLSQVGPVQLPPPPVIPVRPIPVASTAEPPRKKIISAFTLSAAASSPLVPKPMLANTGLTKLIEETPYAYRVLRFLHDWNAWRATVKMPTGLNHLEAYGPVFVVDGPVVLVVFQLFMEAVATQYPGCKLATLSEFQHVMHAIHSDCHETSQLNTYQLPVRDRRCVHVFVIEAGRWRNALNLAMATDISSPQWKKSWPPTKENCESKITHETKASNDPFGSGLLYYRAAWVDPKAITVAKWQSFEQTREAFLSYFNGSMAAAASAGVRKRKEAAAAVSASATKRARFEENEGSDSEEGSSDNDE